MVEKNGVACMAAETLTTFGSWKQPAKYTSRSEKILRVGDAYLGVVGLVANRTVLESVFSGELTLPEVKSELELFEFSRKLHKKLKDDYFLNTGDAEVHAYESTQMTLFLLNRFGMFGLYSNRTVEQYQRFASVGSGSGFALGAMYAAYELDAEAEDIARLGVEAGAEFDDASQAPITIKKMKLAR
jgi:ATP-dependent protease HslVU (ClpYQ) peptidase subunit